MSKGNQGLAVNSDEDIRQFLTGFIEFRPDDSFAPLDRKGLEDQRVVMAASGIDEAEADIERVGVLTNSLQSILIRVFHQRSTGQFRLYLLSDAGANLQGAILSSQNTFKYFLIDSENHTVIPEDSGVDLLKDRLFLTRPDASLHYPATDWEHLRNELTASDSDITMKLRFARPETDESHFSSRPQFWFDIIGNDNTVVLTKLLFKQNSLTRMVPVHQGKACVLVPEVQQSAIDCYLYE